VIGDPISPSQEFPALAYASQEIANIRRHFPGNSQDTFVGAQARPGVYQESRPGRVALLAFSAPTVSPTNRALSIPRSS